MKTKNLIITILSFLAVGFLVGYFLRPNPDNEKIIKQELEIKNLKDARLKDLERFNAFRDTISTLNDLLVASDAEREKERNAAIPEGVTLINEQTILYKGREFYGKEKVKNTKRALVASFGAQGMEEVEVRRRMNENQKAAISSLQGVNLVSLKIEAAKEIIIKELKKETTRKNIKWFFRGTVFGFVLKWLLPLIL